MNVAHGMSPASSRATPSGSFNADATKPMSTGETGELILRAPQLMLEYWNNPLETAETLRTYDSGGPWLHTGDLAYMDEDGYIFIVDRKKDLIKTSGFQVWPREIEEVLAAHPSVVEVGVAGVPDETKGEVVKAWIVVKPGARSAVITPWSQRKAPASAVPTTWSRSLTSWATPNALVDPGIRPRSVMVPSRQRNGWFSPLTGRAPTTRCRVN